MEKQVLNEVVDLSKELMEAPTCSGETKASAQKWLDSVGTDAEKVETAEYLTALEGDIMPLDHLIGFAQSEQGAQYFGAEKAAGIAAHAKDLQKAGEKYCDCPACTVVAKILEKKEELLK